VRIATVTRETVKEHAQWPQRVPPTRLFDRIVELRHDSVKLTLRKDGLSRLVLNGKLGVAATTAVILKSSTYGRSIRARWDNITLQNDGGADRGHAVGLSGRWWCQGSRDSTAVTAAV